MAALRDPPKVEGGVGGGTDANDAGVFPDAATEARDKWIYGECCKRTIYTTIISKLDRKPKTWGRISSPQGIKNPATCYATRHKLPPIPLRQRGRKSGRKSGK